MKFFITPSKIQKVQTSKLIINFMREIQFFHTVTKFIPECKKKKLVCLIFCTKSAKTHTNSSRPSFTRELYVVAAIFFFLSH